MKIYSALFSILSLCTAADAFAPRSRPAVIARGGSIFAATKEKETTEGKKAGKDAPPVQLGWDTHQAVVSQQKMSLVFFSFFLGRQYY